MRKKFLRTQEIILWLNCLFKYDIFTFIYNQFNSIINSINSFIAEIPKIQNFHYVSEEKIELKIQNRSIDYVMRA